MTSRILAPVATEAARAVEPRKKAAENLPEENESLETSSSKKHRKKKTHMKKVRTQRSKATENAWDTSAMLGNADPVRALFDKTVAQSDVRGERMATPRAMEPVEQINPKSYIGLALK